MSDEIMAVQSGSQSITEYSSQKCLPAKLKESITTALSQITEEKTLRVISESLESNAIRKKALKMINPETTYIARIPKKLEGDMKAGLLDFMTDSKTGDNLGVLVNGKNRIKRCTKKVRNTAERTHFESGNADCYEFCAR